MSEQTITNNFESLVSIKIETNSKGHNVSVHVYQNATKEAIDETVKNAVYALNLTQEQLVNNTT